MATRTTAARKPAPAPAKRARAQPGDARAPKTTKPAPGPQEKKPPSKKHAKSRVRLIRDSFTMPESDFALIATLKSRALAAQRETKKSELLRAGLQVLTALDSKALMEVLGRLAPVKVGRPKKGT